MLHVESEGGRPSGKFHALVRQGAAGGLSDRKPRGPGSLYWRGRPRWTPSAATDIARRLLLATPGLGRPLPDADLMPKRNCAPLSCCSPVTARRTKQRRQVRRALGSHCIRDRVGRQTGGIAGLLEHRPSASGPATGAVWQLVRARCANDAVDRVHELLQSGLPGGGCPPAEKKRRRVIARLRSPDGARNGRRPESDGLKLDAHRTHGWRSPVED